MRGQSRAVWAIAEVQPLHKGASRYTGHRGAGQWNHGAARRALISRLAECPPLGAEQLQLPQARGYPPIIGNEPPLPAAQEFGFQCFEVLLDGQQV